jgi:glycosyltransferase involved in cell wall biosynthesis
MTSGPVIGIMVDDLVAWLEEGHEPTGIQRVVIELLDTANDRADLQAWPGVSVPRRSGERLPGLVPIRRANLQFGSPAARGTALRLLVAARGFVVHLPMPPRIRSTAKALYGRIRSQAKAARFAAPTKTVGVLVVPGSFWVNEMPDRILEFADSGVPVRVMVYDIIPLTNPEWCDPNLVAAFTVAFDSVLPVCDRIVTLSQMTARALVGRYPAVASRLTVAVPTPQAHAPRVIPGVIPAGIHGPFILALGTVEPRKNHRVILEAWRLARRDSRLADASLVIAGRKGWRTAELEAEIARDASSLKIVRVTGATDAEIEALHSECQATVHASWGEGFGLPARESVVRGIPTLMSTAIPPDGLPEDRIRLFDPRYPEALAPLMIEAIVKPVARTPLAFGSGTGWEPVLSALLD